MKIVVVICAVLLLCGLATVGALCVDTNKKLDSIAANGPRKDDAMNQIQTANWDHKPAGSIGVMHIKVETPRFTSEAQADWDARHDAAIATRILKYPANV